MGFEELAQRAMMLALRTKDYPEYGAPCLFVRFTGHIKGLEVELYETGWERNKHADVDITIYADKDKSKFMSDTLDYIEHVISDYDFKEAHIR